MTRTVEEARDAWRQALPLRRVGYTLIPLRPNRLPLKGWRTLDYAEFEFNGWLRAGGQIGVRLGSADLVVDVDPRNGGDESLRRLTAEIGEGLDGVPTVRSGGGGTHFYLRKPASLATRVTLPDFPGIDFKRLGGYVVAAGASHPSGGRYQWLRPIGEGVPAAPEPLLRLLHRPRVEIAPAAGSSPLLTPDQLELLLVAVDARQYGVGRRDEWIRLSAACHDAVGGNPHGFEVWADWCVADPDFADLDDDELRRTWNSFRIGKGVTFRTLFKAVSDAGRADLLRSVRETIYYERDVFDVPGEPLEGYE